ncbi:hypothetical protein PROFUN_11260 [Planoprotostelium fungivorum]|uniref:Uncharacterized protein n=1 Tax=Planoprotostelium fungivorum TaxID=1890364 RepID=A0A2P6NAF4_9EUKA|nr:hypothetical protein PROFUN_11260 [Planoprotostelium fungivorum]
MLCGIISNLPTSISQRGWARKPPLYSDTTATSKIFCFQRISVSPDQQHIVRACAGRLSVAFEDLNTGNLTTNFPHNRCAFHRQASSSPLPPKPLHNFIDHHLSWAANRSTSKFDLCVALHTSGTFISQRGVSGRTFPFSTLSATVSSLIDFRSVATTPLEIESSFLSFLLMLEIHII